MARSSEIIIGPPANIELEQALLGCLLYDNMALVEVDGRLTAKDFYEPVHGRMYDAIVALVRKGRNAEPIILRDYMAIDPAFIELGGLRYLADLVDRSPPASMAKEYADSLRSLAVRREVIRVARDVTTMALTEADATGADLMAYMEGQLLQVRDSSDEFKLREWRDVSSEIVYGMDRPDDRPLIRSGLKKVDEATGGFERGDLVVLGARPSMGKSATASCISLNVALAHSMGLSPEPLGVVEVNGEMTTQQMGRRHLTDHAFTRFGEEGPMYRDIKRKVLTPGQMQVLRVVDEELAHIPLKMIKRTGLTIGRLKAMLRRQKMLWAAQGIKLSLVVVDHVGLVRPDEETRGRTEAQTIISGELKALAEDLDVVLLALAQLNRKLEDRDDKRPQLSDLRDSGSWEQDADIVVGVYRDAYYARREREPKSDLKMAEWMARCGSPTVEAIMLKIREGDVATAKLWADIGRNAIRDEAPAFALF